MLAGAGATKGPGLTIGKGDGDGAMGGATDQPYTEPGGNRRREVSPKRGARQAALVGKLIHIRLSRCERLTPPAQPTRRHDPLVRRDPRCPSVVTDNLAATRRYARQSASGSAHCVGSLPQVARRNPQDCCESGDTCGDRTIRPREPSMDETVGEEREGGSGEDHRNEEDRSVDVVQQIDHFLTPGWRFFLPPALNERWVGSSSAVHAPGEISVQGTVRSQRLVKSQITFSEFETQGREVGDPARFFALGGPNLSPPLAAA